MKRKTFSILYLLLAFAFILHSNSAFAQKHKPVSIGYVNSALIMRQMPEIKGVNDKLNETQQKYVEQYNAMLKELQDKNLMLEKDEKNSSITNTVKETKRNEIKDLQNRIVSFQQRVQEDLVKEEEKLVQPIKNKVKKAIEDISKSKNLTYVLDSSSGILIVAPEQEDITNDVKKALHLQ
ncbi:MAG: OmpH family outer membrane protein [Solitalea-like symbiont of Acarus siro]